MTSKKEHLVKLRAKSDLSGTGVDDTLARQMCTHKGRRYMAIVEVVVDELHDKLSGQEAADLSITEFWPATDENLADYLRNIRKAMHRNRGEAEGQLAIDATLDEPTVEGLIKDGARFAPHPFLPVDAGDEEPICDVCGVVKGAGPHPDDTEPDDEPDEPALDLNEDGDVDEDPIADPDWEYPEPKPARG